jgi:hypothetical protein
MPLIREDVGRPYLSTPSYTNSQIYEKRLKHSIVQWSTRLSANTCHETKVILLGKHVTSLEEALLTEGPNDILSRILVCFVRNLRPQTRNVK